MNYKKVDKERKKRQMNERVDNQPKQQKNKQKDQTNNGRTERKKQMNGQR